MIVVSGATVSTVHVRWAGPPVAPFAVALTANAWAPSPSPEYEAGETHVEKPAPSSEHEYVAPETPAVNLNVAEVAVVTDPSAGPEVIVVSGPTSVTVHANWAGADVFPAGSVAVTAKVWPPADRPWNDRGEEQDAGPAPSSEQANATPPSPSSNANDTDGPLGFVGVWVKAGAGGGWVSTVHDLVAGVASVFPAASVAFTVRVKPPSPGTLTSVGDGHGYEPPDRRHWNVEPPSVDVNENENGPGWFTGPLGPDVIAVSGGVTSTVQVRWAGAGSTFPAGSTARTETVCWASVRPVKVAGEEHGANGAPSSEHANVPPDSFDENENTAVVDDVGPVGPASIDVSGGVVSTTHVLTAGAEVPATPLATSLPSATTVNAWGPSASGPGTTTGEAHGARSAPSSEHQVRDAPFDVNDRVAPVCWVAGGGPPVNETAGGWVEAIRPRRWASTAWVLPGAGLATARLLIS